MGPCDACDIDVFAEVLANVPPQNLHVSRGEFGAVWAAAEAEFGRHSPVQGGSPRGRCPTCRWLARAVVPVLPLPGAGGAGGLTT